MKEINKIIEDLKIELHKRAYPITINRGRTLGMSWGDMERYTIHFLKPYLEELGKSICEEEYGMDYQSYYKGTLKCKPFTESYDGIKVEVPKDTVYKKNEKTQS